jgi:transmembrane E3 ubiquitin-protein ligase
LREELLEEVVIMKTPCNHKFHEECLTQWLDVKLECPTCRAVLPPL